MQTAPVKHLLLLVSLRKQGDGAGASIPFPFRGVVMFPAGVWVWGLAEESLLFPHVCIFAALVLWPQLLRGRSERSSQLPAGGFVGDELH